MGVAITIGILSRWYNSTCDSPWFLYQLHRTSQVIVYFFLQIHHVGISPISWSIPSLLGVPRDSGGYVSD